MRAEAPSSAQDLRDRTAPLQPVEEQVDSACLSFPFVGWAGAPSPRPGWRGDGSRKRREGWGEAASQHPTVPIGARGRLPAPVVLASAGLVGPQSPEGCDPWDAVSPQPPQWVGVGVGGGSWDRETPGWARSIRLVFNDT